ncbi:hypothetical protein HDU98_010162 [Podochytrium sp. JEL0797]|nr:hypothetical protein HDU98_010162 [Podochytrium sp. JEL0797]
MTDTLRSQFRASLQELTFNSRPIIMSLTQIAAENVAQAPVIVQAIEDQLRNVAPKIKLSVLYLMDSICKNVGPAYSTLFERNLIQSFTNAYASVSLQDREKFKKVVATWKLVVPTGAHAGRSVFGVDLTGRLDAFMAGARGGGGVGGAVGNGVGQPGPQQSLSSIVLQQQIQALLTQKQNAVLMNPRDTASRDQLGILTQLLVHVGSASMSTTDLQMISHSLSSMMSTTPIPIPIPSASSAVPVFPTGRREDGRMSATNGGGGGGGGRGGEDVGGREVELVRVELSNADIGRVFPKAYLSLYDPTTLQCKQCGTRFPGTTEAGRKKNTAHLDWHFRQNKRVREKGRRAVCREWYLGEEQWVVEDWRVDVEVDASEKGAGAAFFDGEASSGGARGQATVKEPEVIHNIPAEGETNLQCAICKETLEQYYDEAEDMWMIKGAVKVDGVSCYSMSVGGSGEGEGAASGKRKAEENAGEDVKKIRASMFSPSNSLALASNSLPCTFNVEFPLGLPNTSDLLQTHFETFGVSIALRTVVNNEFVNSVSFSVPEGCADYDTQVATIPEAIKISNVKNVPRPEPVVNCGAVQRELE